MYRVTDRERQLVTGDILRAFTWTGTAPELRDRLKLIESAGASEILYTPMGPDISRELRAFAAMAEIS